MGLQYLILDSHSASRIANADVCIVDDVASTGGTIKALEGLRLTWSAGRLFGLRGRGLTRGTSYTWVSYQYSLRNREGYTQDLRLLDSICGACVYLTKSINTHSPN